MGVAVGDTKEGARARVAGPAGGDAGHDGRGQAEGGRGREGPTEAALKYIADTYEGLATRPGMYAGDEGEVESMWLVLVDIEVRLKPPDTGVVGFLGAYTCAWRSFPELKDMPSVMRVSDHTKDHALLIAFLWRYRALRLAGGRLEVGEGDDVPRLVDHNDPP